jgi:ATP-dependent DNA ligase
MECLATAELPTGPGWVWEIKLDGYRALAVKDTSGVSLFSRRKKSLNKKFPYIATGLADLPAGTVVDGELVRLDDSGRPDFNLLQNFRGGAPRIYYYIFDLLCCNDRDLTGLPLAERRTLLKSLVTIQDPRIRFQTTSRLAQASFQPQSASINWKASSESGETASTSRGREPALG